MSKNKANDYDYLGVENVREIEGKKGKKVVVFFTLLYYDAKIYSCTVVDGKKGKFISFPSEKGSDGNYYNKAWVDLDEDEQNFIIDLVDRLID